uniref:Cytochrome c oxidase assembly factor 4 homolog n=1 Tax=Cyprinus carpio carpio TaxID=630221 RepID=A0A8C1FB48_CYPCA
MIRFKIRIHSDPLKQRQKLQTEVWMRMISRTGCAELHYALQDCMAEHQDWRKCQTQVQKFKGCMNTYQNTHKEQLLKQRTSATQSA